MISCRDVNNLQMDGMELVAGGEKSYPQKGYFTQSDQQEGNQCKLHGHIQVYVQ